MKNFIQRLLRNSPAPPPIAPLIDKDFGEFTFERDLGWKGHVPIGSARVELVFGSEGEPPSQEMRTTAHDWISQWPERWPQIQEYIRIELLGWPQEAKALVPAKFEPESICILWPDDPRTSMIYLRYPGDDIRAWHITFNRFEPRGFAYDD